MSKPDTKTLCEEILERLYRLPIEDDYDADQLAVAINLCMRLSGGVSKGDRSVSGGGLSTEAERRARRFNHRSGPIQQSDSRRPSNGRCGWFR